MRELPEEQGRRGSWWSGGIGLVIVIILGVDAVYFIFANTEPIQLSIFPGAPTIPVAPSLLVIICMVLGAVIWSRVRRASRKAQG